MPWTRNVAAPGTRATDVSPRQPRRPADPQGRNEDKVRLAADHLKRELEKAMDGVKDLTIAGPAPAPLLRAETYYRHQILLRAPRMRGLSQRLAGIAQGLVLPEYVTISVDIDPVNLG